MNLKEYLNSGIIEDYCLGTLNPLEMCAVARNAEGYPEIQDAIHKAERVLKKYAEELDKNKSMAKRRNEIFFSILRKMKNK
jgi:predicted DNA-binding protein YlxM (UPF0122 family)